MRPPRSYLMLKAAAAAEMPDGDGAPPPSPPPSTIRWMAQLCEGEGMALSAGVVGMLIASGTNLVFPRILGKAIDVASGKPPPAGLSRRNFLWAVVATAVVGALGSMVRVYSLGMVQERMAARLRRRLYRALLAQDLGFFHRRRVGELITRLSHDCHVTASTVVEVLANGFRALNSAVGASCMLFSLSPKLTLVALSVLPLVGSGAMVFSKLSGRLYKVHLNAVAAMTGVAEERLNNIFTVKLFAAEQYEEQAFEEANTLVLTTASRAKAARGALFCGLALSTNCSLLSVLYFGGSLVGKGEMTVGALASFAIYSVFSGLGFSQLMSSVGEAKRARESSSALFGLLQTLPTCEENQGQQTLKTVQGSLRMENICFSYPSRPDVNVLDGLNLDIKAGEVVAIVGKSGAGKTTTASLITKILAPTSGSVSLDGVDVRKLKTSWLRRQIGVVNQEPSLFASTVAENIMYGSPVRDRARMMAAAKEAHADEFINELPDDYDTFVGEKGFELSGGQKQRLAIARALYKHSRVLIFDEATSSLDGRSEEMIHRALDEVAHNRTVLIIAHRLATIKHAQRIVVLEEGKVVESGTFEELSSQDTHFQRLVHDHAGF